MSVNNWPTLKGVFPGPKPEKKRDFLRENKVKIKDLQRTVSKKQLQLENDDIARNRRWKSNGSNLPPQLDTDKRSISLNRISSGCSCMSRKTLSSMACGTNDENTSRTKVCDKEIQTDDIADESYLYSALQRCMSADPQNLEIELPQPLQNYTDRESHTDGLQFNGYIPSTISPENIDVISSAKLCNNFENIRIEKYPPPQTATSSTDLLPKRKTTRNGILEFKNRAEIRLPKYLEREKREKEEQRIMQEMKDPFCPDGHYSLCEEERLDRLKATEKEFQSLVNELNRMPMTTETLRLRSRKVEIERDLVQLENEVRLYSKPKVYIKFRE